MAAKLPKHIIVEDKKEVWFLGSMTMAMGLKRLVAQHFPGYVGKLASQEYFIQLQDRYGED